MSYEIKTISIVTINEPSLAAGIRLKEYLSDYEVDIYNKSLDEDGFIKYAKIDDVMPKIWGSDAIIFLIATGIVVRKIAPFLEHKTKDPAVIMSTIDLLKFVPLLSGHIGGANELCEEIVGKIDGAISFTTTATDQTKTLAFDMFAKKYDMKINNIKSLACISNRLINKLNVKLITYKSIYEKLPSKEFIEFIDIQDFDKNILDETCVIISPFYFECENLFLIPKYSIGIGMNRGVSKLDIEKSIKWFSDKFFLDLNEMKQFASFEAKADEEGLLEYINENKYNIKFFNKEDINSLENEFSKSAATKFFELKGVAEPSSLLNSKFKELVIKKEVFEGKITIALSI